MNALLDKESLLRLNRKIKLNNERMKELNSQIIDFLNEGQNNELDTLKECMDYINKKHDEQIKNKLINCPNCGAPITDIICEYCGTVF